MTETARIITTLSDDELILWQISFGELPRFCMSPERRLALLARMNEIVDEGAGGDVARRDRRAA